MLLLRKIRLIIDNWGGTNFYSSNLVDSEFSKLKLNNSRFKNAKFNKCHFQNTKNHHLALFENTPLAHRKVRDLVIDGIITDKNFASLDLRGLDFSNLNLQEFDFSHSNLSGANLSHTQLTGAILEGWNIDTETCLDNIECRYYYYLENGTKKRMPPEKDYEESEFTTIFQHLAKTVSIIAHNAVELAAIKLSVEQVSKERENAGIQIQSINVKNGAIVVGIAVPKTEDAGVLHHEIKELIQAKVALVEKNLKLKGKLEGQQEHYQQLLNTLNNLKTGDTVMGDKIEIGSIGSSVIGVIGSGKIENSFNTTTNNQNELEELLNQLQTLINSSPLSDTSKQKALSKTQEIAEVSKKPEVEQKSVVEKTLGYFDGLNSSLESGTEISLKLGETIAKIALLFGV